MPASRIIFQPEGSLPFALKNATKIKSWIRAIAKQEGKKIGTISYLFCTDKYLLSINQEFLNHNFYTDIITFDYSDKQQIEGEIFISVDRVKENALTFNQPFQKELHRTIIHGVLHLCGYKDKTKSAQKIMRTKEDEALASFRI